MIFLLIFGGTEYLWSQSIIIMIAGTMLIAIAIGLFRQKNINLSYNLITVIALVFIGLCVFTVIPLPKFILKFLSPKAFEIYQNYLPGYLNGSGLFPLRSISLSPYRTLQSIFILCSFLIISTVMLPRLRSEESRTKLVYFIVISGLAIALWGLASMFFQNGKLFWVKKVTSGKPVGPFMNSIHFAAFMAINIPIALGFWLYRIANFNELYLQDKKLYLKKIFSFVRAYVVYLMPACVMIIALLKAHGRGAVISFVISMGIFALLLLFKSRNKKILIATMIVVVILVSAGFQIDNGGFSEKLVSLADPFATDSGQTRLSLWRSSLNMLSDFPVFGTGLNSFVNILPMYKTICGSGKMYFTHAENDYIETASEVGILGVIFLFALIYLFLQGFLRDMNRLKKDKDIFLKIGIASSLAAALCGAVTDFIFHIPLIFLFFIITCIVYFPLPLSSYTIKVSKGKNNALYSGIKYTILLSGIIFILFAAKTVAGQIFYLKYLNNKDDFEVSEAAIIKAISFDKNPEYYYRLGRVYHLKGKDKKPGDLILKAKNVFDEAVEIDPAVWEYHYYKGSSELLYAALSGGRGRKMSIVKAQNELEKALELNPTRYDVHMLVGEYYLNFDMEKALYHYGKVPELRPWRIKMVFEALWAKTKDPDVLEKIVPDETRQYIAFIDFLISKRLRVSRYFETLINMAKDREFDDMIIASMNLKKYGYYKGADECLISAIENTPGKENVVYYNNNDYNTNTSDILKDKLLTDQDNIALRYNYALMLYEEGQFKEAFSDFSKVLEGLKRKN